MIEITQRRRVTIDGRYHYQQRIIRSSDGWVQTCAWETRFINEIGRKR